MTKIEAGAGTHIDKAIERAIAASVGDVVEFDFNGVTVRVGSNSDPKLVHRDWDRALRGCTGKVVGPHYKATLSPAEIAHDAAVNAANERRRQEQLEEMRRKDAARRAKVDALIEGVAIQLTNTEDWEKSRLANQDGYGGAAFRYGDRFGRVMQVEIAKGLKVAEAAAKWEFDVDDDGLTGFQQSCALGLLYHCWKHGPDLKKWHDTKYGR